LHTYSTNWLAITVLHTYCLWLQVNNNKTHSSMELKYRF